MEWLKWYLIFLMIKSLCKIFCLQLLPSKVRISILVLEQLVLHLARFLLMSVGSDTSLNPHETFDSLPVVALLAGDLICWCLPLWILCDVYPCMFGLLSYWTVWTQRSIIRLDYAKIITNTDGFVENPALILKKMGPIRSVRCH